MWRVLVFKLVWMAAEGEPLLYFICIQARRAITNSFFWSNKNFLCTCLPLMRLDCISWFLASARFLAAVLRNISVFTTPKKTYLLAYMKRTPWQVFLCCLGNSCIVLRINSYAHIYGTYLLWPCLLPRNASHYHTNLFYLPFIDYEMDECVPTCVLKTNGV